VVTVLAVRHADIDLPPTVADPQLNAAGRIRAGVLAGVVGRAGVTTIVTSTFRRTQQTVEPLVRLLGAAPRVAPPTAELARLCRAGRFGDVVVVAGHSNTVPELLGALGVPAAPVITEAEFDNLFVVTVLPTSGSELLALRYGAGSTLAEP
jgi:broad specificity phosphatase PhoE